MPETLSGWVSLALSVIALVGIVWGWATAGDKKAVSSLSTKVGEVDDKLDGHAQRIQAIENEMKHLPSKDSVLELKLAMAELKGTVGRLDESLGSVQRTVLRIDDYLRQDRGK